jgi:hypothetical protein
MRTLSIVSLRVPIHDGQKGTNLRSTAQSVITSGMTRERRDVVTPSGTRRPSSMWGSAIAIGAMYVLDLPTAAIVVAEWLDVGESSTQGTWERR